MRAGMAPSRPATVMFSTDGSSGPGPVMDPSISIIWRASGGVISCRLGPPAEASWSTNAWACGSSAMAANLRLQSSPVQRGVAVHRLLLAGGTVQLDLERVSAPPRQHVHVQVEDRLERHGAVRLEDVQALGGEAFRVEGCGGHALGHGDHGGQVVRRAVDDVVAVALRD